MKKSIAIAMLCAVVAFADTVGMGQQDLLNVATAGKNSGAAYELDSKAMESVKGGSYLYQTTVYTSMYKQTVGKITEGYYGNPATMYARRMNNGSVSVWINYTSGGYTYQAYGSEATRLTNLYQSQALSRL